MFLCAVNSEGAFYSRTEGQNLIFSTRPELATIFDSELLLAARKDPAWVEVFRDLDSGLLRWVPSPIHKFIGVSGGCAVYLDADKNRVYGETLFEVVDLVETVDLEVT